MCEVLDRAEQRGKTEQAKAIARNFYAMGLSIEDIAKGAGYAADVVRGWVLPAADAAKAK